MRYKLTDLVELSDIQDIFELFHDAHDFSMMLTNDDYEVLLVIGDIEISPYTIEQSKDYTGRPAEHSHPYLFKSGDKKYFTCPIMIEEVCLGHIIIHHPQLADQGLSGKPQSEQDNNTRDSSDHLHKEFIFSDRAVSGISKYHAGVISRMARKSLKNLQEIERIHNKLGNGERHYYSLIQQLADGVLIVDFASKKIVECNRRFLEMTDYDFEGIIQKSIYDLLPDKKEYLEQSFEELLATGYMENKRGEIQDKNGRKIEIERTAALGRLGEQKFILYAIRDVSRQRHIQQQVLRVQRMEELGILAGGIAHDFNNILSIILGYAEQMKADLSPDHTAAYKNTIEIINAGLRARDIISRILAFSEQGEREWRVIDIDCLVKETLKMLRPTFPSTVQFIYQPDKNKHFVKGDFSELQQLLMNLCINAEKAMQDTGGTLGIYLYAKYLQDKEEAAILGLQTGDYIELSVSDTGVGMDQNTLERVFTPFFSTRKGEGGTGLGLSVVHAVVRNHGGAITVDSIKGQGSTFKVYLPASSSVLEEVENLSLPERSPARILFVDDEEAIVKITEVALRRMGYQVTAIPAAYEALEVFIKDPQRFDLVITDETMPELTGKVLASKIMAIRPDIPVILCTGYSHEEMTRNYRAAGIADILQKPVLSQDYVVAIEKALDNAPSRQKKTSMQPINHPNWYETYVDEFNQDRFTYKPGDVEVIDQHKNDWDNGSCRLAVLEAVIAGMAHEIRQPLSAITIASNEALYWNERGKPLPPEEILEDMKNILGQVKRVDTIIKDMGHFIRRKEEEVPEVYNLNEVVERTAKLVSSRLFSHGISLEMQFTEEPLYIIGFRIALEEGIVLLLSEFVNLASSVQGWRAELRVITGQQSGPVLNLLYRTTNPETKSFNNLPGQIQIERLIRDSGGEIEFLNYNSELQVSIRFESGRVLNEDTGSR